VVGTLPGASRGRSERGRTDRPPLVRPRWPGRRLLPPASQRTRPARRDCFGSRGCSGRVCIAMNSTTPVRRRSRVLSFQALLSPGVSFGDEVLTSPAGALAWSWRPGSGFGRLVGGLLLHDKCISDVEALAPGWMTPGGVTPRPRLLSRTVSRAAARGRRCAHSRRDVLRSSRWSKVSAPRSGETNRRRARRTHSRRAPVADLARSLPRARPAERRAGGASRKRMPSEQMRLSICSCRESLERSPRSASRRSAPATFASRAVR
jgi:hypothetical protein